MNSDRSKNLQFVRRLVPKFNRITYNNFIELISWFLLMIFHDNNIWWYLINATCQHWEKIQKEEEKTINYSKCPSWRLLVSSVGNGPCIPFHEAASTFGKYTGNYIVNVKFTSIWSSKVLNTSFRTSQYLK